MSDRTAKVLILVMVGLAVVTLLCFVFAALAFLHTGPIGPNGSGWFQ